MSYLVLARRWRPRSFGELVGQEHVRRALMNALESGRIHHAFLFTGTRGVGKTTIARILAKSLNCETGVTATPCGKCVACQEIDAGRFVDLIEVDAASRTKVDDTRELLDNVQYMPARGRFKVYLVDEVHMLSTHSFNALLKTLEEPPAHVKFLLATTDPQKLPVTVLSRCLQFNLKRLSPELIGRRLAEILAAEQIEFEAEAVRLVAHAAEGSLRDALSLLDQVIAFGGAKVTGADTRQMLGTVDRGQVTGLLQALAERDGRQLLERVAALDEYAPDYRQILGELAIALQQIAVLQSVPEAGAVPDDAEAEAMVLRALAGTFLPDDVQLLYQIALIGRRDLELAPDPRSGMEMVLLRMLAFTPPETAIGTATTTATTPAATPSAVGRGAEGRRSALAPAAPIAPSAISTPPPPAQAAPAASGRPGDDWSALLPRLGLSGATSQLAAHCTLVGREPGLVRLLLDSDGELFRRPAYEGQLVQALSAHFGEPTRVEFVAGGAVPEAPARRRQAESDDRIQQARAAIDLDPNVQAMRDIFGAVVQAESVRPVERPARDSS